MKILSIDVGIKNLAFCLFERINNNNLTNLSQTVKNQYKIKKWDVINISEENTLKCNFVDDKNICDKVVKFRKNHQCFCIKHSKKQPFLIPNNELKLSFIKKQKISTLIDIANKYKIIYTIPIKKAQLLSLINDYIQEKCFETVIATNASKTDLITIGRNIKYKFEQTFIETNSSSEKQFAEIIDHIVIENQISPIANRMKTIQGMIAQYFIMTNNTTNIEFVSASNKLKDCDKTNKIKYSDRKKLGIAICYQKLNDEFKSDNMTEYFNNHKKKDDLADSFLQGLWFINNRNL